MNQAAAAYSNAAKIGGGAAVAGPQAPESLTPSMKPDFSELVTNALGDAASAGYKTESLSTQSLAGKAEMHELVAAVANAELTLNTVVAIRDKVIGAYNDIVKMPI